MLWWLHCILYCFPIHISMAIKICYLTFCFLKMLFPPQSGGWVGLWGFLWWAPSAKRKDHHGVSSGCSSVWHRSNTGLSSTQYEQIPIILGVWTFWLTPFFFRSITFWRVIQIKYELPYCVTCPSMSTDPGSLNPGMRRSRIYSIHVPGWVLKWLNLITAPGSVSNQPGSVTWLATAGI